VERHHHANAAIPQLFQDIVTGNNGASEQNTCPNQGFNAAVGWDATTGWGTPNVGNLAQMLMNMSPAPPSSFTWGPDVSSAQGTVTWSSVQAAGASFAFAQASQGTSYTDPQFAANWQGISSAGLVRGAYHYGNPCNSGVQEATNFVNVVQAQGALSPKDMLVLNIQTSCSNPPDGSIESYITNFLTQVSQSTSSSNLMIYTLASYWNANVGGSSPLTSDYPVWVSGFTSSPPVPAGWNTWTYWQWNGASKVQGITGTVSTSYLNPAA